MDNLRLAHEKRSNAAQIITSILLLRTRQILVLQTSLVGAILNNLLLMPGFAFLLGGWNRTEQFFNITVASTIGTMLLLAILSLMIPTAVQLLTKTSAVNLLQQSRGTSVVLLLCYGLLLLFQLKTHAAMFNEPSLKVPKRETAHTAHKDGEAKVAIAQIGAGAGAISTRIDPPHDEDDEEDEEEVPQLHLLTALATLIAATTILTFNTSFATDSINGLLEEVGMTETFLGIVILPLLGNDPATLIVAVKDKMDLTLDLTLGKCVQTALLVIPFIVILAWMMAIDLTLNFGSFETLVMLAGVLVVNHVIQDGKSNW